MMWCLNFPAAAPIAAYNTDPELLLESVGKPSKLPWCWWAFNRAKRYEGLKAVEK